MTDTELAGLMPVIQRAARNVSDQWPGVIEADDVEQEIIIRLLESKGSLSKVAAMDSAAKYRAIVGMGHQLASQERTDYDHFKGSYRYSVEEVKSLLSRGVLTEPVEGFEEAVFDLMEALEALVVKTPQYVDSITLRYADGIVPKGGADKVRLSDALSSLADQMNKSNRIRFSERDHGPGTRGHQTNDQARWESKSSWDADYSPETASFRDNRIEPESIPFLGTI